MPSQPSLWQKKSFSITTTCCRALYDHLSLYSVLSAKHSSCGRRHCDESSFMCTVCVSIVSRINYRLSKCSVLIIAADIFFIQRVKISANLKCLLINNLHVTMGFYRNSLCLQSAIISVEKYIKPKPLYSLSASVADLNTNPTFIVVSGSR